MSASSNFFDRYARVTSSGRYLPELDGLRFIAIAAVFFQHASQALATRLPKPLVPDLLLRGIGDAHFGVELFFVISGFILGLPFALEHLKGHERVPLRAYFVRRLTRLEPPYVLSLVLFAILALIEGRSLGNVGSHFLAHLFYLHVLIFGQFHPGSLNPVTWSLEIEVQFYVLAPLLARVFLVRSPAMRRSLLVVVSIAAFGSKHLLLARFPGCPPTLLSYLQYFMGGFLVADLYVTDWRESLSRRTELDIVALCGWVGLPILFLVHVPAMSLVCAFLLTVLVILSLHANWTRRILAHRFVRTVGGMCYSIYLLHFILIFLFTPFLAEAFNFATGPQSFAFGMLSAVPILLLSAQYFRWVERPCMKRNWWKARSAKGAEQ